MYDLKWLFSVAVIVVAAAGQAMGLELNDENGSKEVGINALPKDVQWWRDAKFGMFIHWGPVTLTGEEISWSRISKKGKGITPAEVYDKLYTRWKPDKFDARQWVQLARDTGMKYMIFTAKHHDGFCLYDTKLTDHKITSQASAWRHDVMADIAGACHEAGLKLFVYYSQPDWHHPDYKTKNHSRYIEYLHGQIRELLTSYGRIDGLWFDGLNAPATLWDAEKLFKMARGIQPWLIINDRCGLPGDFATAEQNIGGFETQRPWESCITIGEQWSWKPDDQIKSLRECIGIVVKTVGRGGNLALNVGPTVDGQVEPGQAVRLREIGDWLKIYGESIYGTSGGPFPGQAWGVSTCKGNKIYLHILGWRSDVLKLSLLPKKIIGHSVLTGGSACIKQAADGIEISVAKIHRQDIDTIIVMELDGPAGELKPTIEAAGLYSTKASASSARKYIWHGVDVYGPARAFDDNFKTFWSADKDLRQGWLALDMETPTTFSRVLISEAEGNRIQKFELQYQENDTWHTFAERERIGEKLDLGFAPITASRVRLNILKADGTPAISEFQLFNLNK